jgi:hypothetical protein
MAEAIGFLIGQVIGAAIGALIGAIFVRIATKMAAGFTPPYGTAYLAAFLGYAASLVLGFVIGLVIGASGQTLDGGGTVLIMIIGFFVQAAVYASLLKHPETGNISYGKACLVSLIQLVMAAVIIGVIVLIVMAAAK